MQLLKCCIMIRRNWQQSIQYLEASVTQKIKGHLVNDGTYLFVRSVIYHFQYGMLEIRRAKKILKIEFKITPGMKSKTAKIRKHFSGRGISMYRFR